VILVNIMHIDESSDQVGEVMVAANTCQIRRQAGWSGLRQRRAPESVHRLSLNYFAMPIPAASSFVEPRASVTNSILAHPSFVSDSVRTVQGEI
jgi:hypothetical protein